MVSMMSERRRRWLLVLPLLGALAGCSTSPTPYQAATDGYGYSEQQLEESRYRVTFHGNTATSRDQVENYALYRAAELTLQQGHDYFKVVSRSIEPTADSYRAGGPSIGVGVGGGGGNIGVGVSTLFGGGRSSYSYAGYLDVVMYDGEKPADDREAYDAWQVIESLKPKVNPGTESSS